MRITGALAFLCVVIGCGEDDGLPVIHPTVFSMVDCWLSDTAAPVATEINLDAVRENDDQFFEEITTDGGWVRSDIEGGGFVRYRVLRSRGDSHVVEFQSNGGGSLTTSRQIGFTLSHRSVEVDGRRKRVRVLRVDSLAH